MRRYCGKQVEGVKGTCMNTPDHAGRCDHDCGGGRLTLEDEGGELLEWHLDGKGGAATTVSLKAGETKTITTPTLEELKEGNEAAAAIRDRYLVKLHESGKNLRRDLAELSRRLDAGDLFVNCCRCEICGVAWKEGPGHYAKCPKCYPAQISLIEILTNRNAWPGHDWIWDHCLGPRGRWRLLEDVAWVPIEDIRAIAVELEDRLGAGERTLPGAVREIKKLKALAAEVSGATRDRALGFERKYSQACDLLGELEGKLRKKRVECDRLRDELHAAHVPIPEDL